MYVVKKGDMYAAPRPAAPGSYTKQPWNAKKFATREEAEAEANKRGDGWVIVRVEEGGP
jgi:hypothetical protein